MDKQILQQYSDALARVKYIRQSIEKLTKKLDEMGSNGYCVADSVTKGKKGKKPLGTAVVTGFPYPEYSRAKMALTAKKAALQQEELELLELSSCVEEYICSIQDIEARNILSLYYIENLNWVQVAQYMNGLYGRRKRYTENSCRRKHDRFLEKNERNLKNDGFDGLDVL